MSLVGPRPHAVAHNEEYRKLIKGYMVRHKVLPGITGLAQVNGCRGETSQLEEMEARVNFDLDYLRHWSPMLDIKIILLTAIEDVSRREGLLARISRTQRVLRKQGHSGGDEFFVKPVRAEQCRAAHAIGTAGRDRITRLAASPLRQMPHARRPSRAAPRASRENSAIRRPDGYWHL